MGCLKAPRRACHRCQSDAPHPLDADRTYVRSWSVANETTTSAGAPPAVRLRASRIGVLRVPERQLDQDQPVKHLVPVLRLLRDAKYTDEEALAWLTTEDPSLPGTPLDALHENRATEVKRRAQALGF